MTKYVNLEGIEIPVVICSYIVQTWLCKLGFVYKEICKNVFIDGYKRSNVVEDQNCFLTKMEKLKPYIIEFNEDGTIKAKDYLLNAAIGGKECYPIIEITHDECTFSANVGIRKV